jgi:hypothetical protein
MNALRLPFYIATLVCLVLAIAGELGTGAIAPPERDRKELEAAAIAADPPLPDPALATGDERQSRQHDVDERLEEMKKKRADNGLDKPPSGLGVPFLALIDVMFLFVVLTVAAGFLVSSATWSRIHGWSVLLAGLLGIIVGVLLVLFAFAKLMLMLGLFLAAPFGTLVYIGVFGFFERGSVGALLSTTLALKVAGSVCLVLALQRILENRALVALALTSMVASVIVSFLHGIVPGLLVSITDAVAALVVAILGIVWGFVLFLTAIPAVVASLRPRPA